jgi:hypothetical protein
MAEVVMLACDRCGKPAVESVTLKVGGRNLVIDLCRVHLDELVKGARTPKRGRKPASLSAATPPKRRGRPPGSKNKTTGRKKPQRRKSTRRKTVASKA